MTSVCVKADFQDFIDAIGNTWPSMWATATTHGPIQAGLSFGSCYTSCGSLGLTDVNGVGPINLDLAQATATFTTCSAEDYVILTVPFEQTTVLFDVQVRASGPTGLYPSGIGQYLVSNAPAAVSGFVLVYIPVRGSLLIASELRVDWSLYATWTTTWPDTTNILYNSIPWASILNQWTESFVQYLRSNLRTMYQNELRSQNELLGCHFPPEFAQTCEVSTEMPNAPCHPCDTCCKCLIQQKCNGECASCDCVDCQSYNEWSVNYAFFITLVVLFVVAWFMDANDQYEYKDLYGRPNTVEAFPDYV